MVRASPLAATALSSARLSLAWRAACAPASTWARCYAVYCCRAALMRYEQTNDINNNVKNCN